MKKRISVLVSGGGTNLQAVIDGVANGAIPDAEVVLIISSRKDAFALERGGKAGIPGVVIDKDTYHTPEERTRAMMEALSTARTDLVVLAGYMSVLEPAIVRAYEGRIINIHPSLIPRHCGKGFYGKRVHEAVLAAGDAETGATVHFVDEGVDTGNIIIQERVPVLPEDTADSLAKRVLATEHRILTEAVGMVLAALPKESEGK